MENRKDTKRLDTKNAQIKDIVSREFSKFVSFVSPFGPFFRRQNSSQIVKYCMFKVCSGHMLIDMSRDFGA